MFHIFFYDGDGDDDDERISFIVAWSPMNAKTSDSIQKKSHADSMWL